MPFLTVVEQDQFFTLVIFPPVDLSPLGFQTESVHTVVTFQASSTWEIMEAAWCSLVFILNKKMKTSMTGCCQVLHRMWPLSELVPRPLCGDPAEWGHIHRRVHLPSMSVHWRCHDRPHTPHRERLWRITKDPPLPTGLPHIQDSLSSPSLSLLSLPFFLPHSRGKQIWSCFLLLHVLSDKHELWKASQKRVLSFFLLSSSLSFLLFPFLPFWLLCPPVEEWKGFNFLQCWSSCF